MIISIIAAASMVALDSLKLEFSMLILSRCDRAKVAYAAEVSVVAGFPCAVDGTSLDGQDCKSERPERTK